MKDLDLPATNCAPVTVIIPAYNVESCLERAVSSALEQEPPPLEVIVINDGSTDKTSETAGGFGARIRYMEQFNQGPAAARNTGLAMATGKYVAFLDADDYWLPGFIQATVAFMEAHPDAVAVSTGSKYKTSSGEMKSFPPAKTIENIPSAPVLLENFYDFFACYSHVLTGTVLIRKSKLKSEDNQRTDLRICEDLEYWVYLGTLGSWGFIPGVFWFGDSASVASNAGWIEKYKIRRSLCPTVELWQARIIPALKSDDWPGFGKIRGRVAAICAHNMILAGRFRDAKKIFQNHETEMPKNRVTKLMGYGYRMGSWSWIIVCYLFLLREYQKAFLLYLLNHKLIKPLDFRRR